MNPALWWQQLGLVMAGGALGAGLRFWIGGVMLRQFGNTLPYGTMAANFLGAFVAGFLLVWLEHRGAAALYLRAFLIVGVLGGLTTFSSLMMESLIFFRSGRSAALLANLGISLAGGLVLVALGAWLALQLRPAS
ncbi:fluoride efflux transporter CrcB [Pseudoxanthomonas composti]|uniref:Fluoride-specific ion channel FluC n=1 Tax=Pseudoxanthomonas composti TaxID=2137479 RepID=A0A4Q1JXF4_9GAMM|nr:fluoride efflux transporter CrcB [Pseudoxanthomonas composti]RXR07361.1 fluoride efflux transporter CrcB [Pseudoxanthomonas composti]